MIEATVGHILSKGVKADPAHCIYVVSDGDVQLYVGMSERNIITRLQEHFEGYDSLGRLVRRNMPEAWDWWVTLFTVEDCRANSVRQAENKLIAELQPCLNIRDNSYPTPLPERYYTVKKDKTSKMVSDRLGL